MRTERNNKSDKTPPVENLAYRLQDVAIDAVQHVKLFRDDALHQPRVSCIETRDLLRRERRA